MTELTFDAENHIYRLGNRILPSVTEILKDVGLIDDAHFTEYATDRGSKVHRMCLYYDEGNLDETSLDKELRGYLKAYHSFRQSMPLLWTEKEYPLFDKELGFAGTPDRVGIDWIRKEKWVVDIKTSTNSSRWWGLQTAGYQSLAKTEHKLTVRLSKDGRFRVDDWNNYYSKAWQSALNLYNWKRG